ncbi:MAG TPA: Rne/Rng family ribonuclease [Actinomycetota bacterium]|nr:Rne/Rng family ribonuclease [Actinomycetota bacterium]
MTADGSASTSTGTRQRRRRRGGRGRGRSGAAKATGGDDAAADTSEPAPKEDAETSESAPASTATRRRRRGGRGRGTSKKPAAAQEGSDGDGSAAKPKAKEPARTTRTRKSTAKKSDAAKSGSKTRTATKAEAAEDEGAPSRVRRKRQGRATVRRRRESMPVVPRLTDKLMVITEHGERDQLAVLEGRELVQHYVTRVGAKSMVGNVYLGRVQNVLPGMEAAFVDVGRGRNAVLYAGEVNWSPEDLEGPSPPRIEQVLKSGQSVLVQVTKDPIGGKGARLTAQISLPGRYLVLAPNSDVSGISRRLPDAERRRLRAIFKELKPEQHGLIVRTAAEGASREALATDLDRLVGEWAQIDKRAKKAKAPAVLYEEPELTVRVVRDLFTDEEYRELVTDSPRVFGIVTDYLRDVAPDVLAKVRLHEGSLPAFEEFHIVEQIHKGLDRKVWLPSGGYLVIDRTEALTVIDVNTGKSVGKTNLEETVVNTNLEAARETARQLRLRDIGGMIVIDFIDMLLEQNKKKVIDAMKEALAQDKSRSQVFDISPLGLLEVTRKRVSGGLLESFSEPCPTCEGRGLLITYDVN